MCGGLLCSSASRVFVSVLILEWSILDHFLPADFSLHALDHLPWILIPFWLTNPVFQHFLSVLHLFYVGSFFINFHSGPLKATHWDLYLFFLSFNLKMQKIDLFTLFWGSALYKELVENMLNCGTFFTRHIFLSSFRLL